MYLSKNNKLGREEMVRMYRVLIVDDEVEILNGLKQYFPWKDFGFKVVFTAQNGREALKYIYKNHVDVLICDIRMPVMTGIQLAEQVTEQFPDIYIIFLSAYKDFEYARAALKYNVKDYILKPVYFEEMKNLLYKVKSDLDKRDSLKKETKDINYSDKMVMAMKKYIENNMKDASLDGLADILDMNTQYVSKYFKDKMGINFSDYLLKVRMEKARSLLDDIRYKIYEVSFMVGYKSSKNFTRAFKKYYGLTPKEYRNKSKIED